MKKQVLLLLIALFFGVGCQKDISTVQQQTPTTATTSVDEKQMVRDQAESLGKTAYRHLKFFFTQKKPEDYINPLIRKDVVERIEKITSEFKDLTAEQTIQKAESENRISKPVAKAMKELLILGNSTEAIESIVEFENRFRAFEENTLSIKDLDNDEKVIIIGSSTMLRGIVRFQEEMERGRTSVNASNNIIQARNASCPLGNRKTSCFVNAIVKAGVAAAIGAVKTLVTGGTLGVSAVVDFIFASFSAIANVFFDNSCKCSDTPGCYHPQIINPIIDPNSPCTAASSLGFAVSGTGVEPNVFHWFASRKPAGSPYDIPIPNVWNVPTSVPLLSPFEILNPTDLITLKVVTICNGNEDITVYQFTLQELLGDPGSVFISGPTQVSLNTTGTFYMSGGCLANPNNQYSWNSPSAGYIVSGGNSSSVNIKFTTRTCYSYNGWSTSCFPVYIIANSVNPCSSLQNSNAFSVTVP